MADIVISIDPVRSQSALAQSYQVSISTPVQGRPEPQQQPPPPASPPIVISADDQSRGRHAITLRHDFPPDLLADTPQRFSSIAVNRAYLANQDNSPFLLGYNSSYGTPRIDWNTLRDRESNPYIAMARRSYENTLNLGKSTRGNMIDTYS